MTARGGGGGSSDPILGKCPDFNQNPSPYSCVFCLFVFMCVCVCECVCVCVCVGIWCQVLSAYLPITLTGNSIKETGYCNRMTGEPDWEPGKHYIEFLKGLPHEKCSSLSYCTFTQNFVISNTNTQVLSLIPCHF